MRFVRYSYDSIPFDIGEFLNDDDLNIGQSVDNCDEQDIKNISDSYAYCVNYLLF